MSSLQNTTMEPSTTKPTDATHSILPSPPTSPVSLGNPTTTRIRLKATRAPKMTVTIPASMAGGAEATQGDFASTLAGSEVHSTITPASAKAKAKRRQSSIAYFTSSSPSPWDREGYTHRRSLSRAGLSSVSSPSSRGGLLDGERACEDPTGSGIRSGGGKRESLVLSAHSGSKRESLCSVSQVEERGREPLTLVEEHADLLHFIAQKERKCLELREQLALHEKELAELKRKWERIVNRNLATGGGGYDNPVSGTGTGAALGTAALDGLKEGVRKIAAGFSDLGNGPGNPQELVYRTSTENDTPVPSRSTNHFQRESDSSLSSSPLSRLNSSGRVSRSSVSSFGEADDQAGSAADNTCPLNGVRSSSTETTFVTPSIRRSGSLHRRTTRSRSREGSVPCAITDPAHRSRQQSVNGAIHETPLPSRLPESQPISTLPPSTGPPLAPVEGHSVSRQVSSIPTVNARDTKQPQRVSLASGFPPPSSVPGLGSLAIGAGVGSPVSSWVGSMGKKLGGIQGADTCVHFSSLSHAFRDCFWNVAEMTFLPFPPAPRLT
ncbi:hypothetical protein ID866_7579 [Astraeus odoratus]|nr:hypothetical protein ID866_7579 [Astraeus odoratus]